MSGGSNGGDKLSPKDHDPLGPSGILDVGTGEHLKGTTAT